VHPEPGTVSDGDVFNGRHREPVEECAQGVGVLEALILDAGHPLYLKEQTQLVALNQARRTVVV
jgi:hypothetical protein